MHLTIWWFPCTFCQGITLNQSSIAWLGHTLYLHTLNSRTLWTVYPVSRMDVSHRLVFRHLTLLKILSLYMCPTAKFLQMQLTGKSKWSNWIRFSFHHHLVPPVSACRRFKKPLMTLDKAGKLVSTLENIAITLLIVGVYYTILLLLSVSKPGWISLHGMGISDSPLIH